MIIYLVQRIGTVASHENFPSYHHPQLTLAHHVKLVSAFNSILFNYVQKYARARGNIKSRAQILKDCKGEIINSPLREDNAVELPSGVCLVSKFIQSCYTVIATLITHRPSENFFALLGQRRPEGGRGCNGSLVLCKSIDA